MTKTGKIRLQFEFTESQVSDLDALTLLMDSANRAETVRRSLRIVKRLIESEKISPT